MKWIQASEQLPIKFQDLLMFSQYMGTVVGYYDGKHYCIGNQISHSVTHWIPLPKEPCDD